MNRIIRSQVDVGGIVHTMADGTVDHCWVNADLINVESGGLGGVVFDMTGGEIRNSYNGRGEGSLTCRGGYVGGFVAYMKGGSIVNCYTYCDLTQSTVSTKGLFAGTVTGGTVTNCYGFSFIPSDASTRFYGNRTGGTLVSCYSRVASDDVSAFAGSDYAALATILTDNRPNTTDYRAWVNAPGRPPVFVTSKKR